MIDRIKIGNFLRELRSEKNLTQEEVAERFGVSSRSVSRWENGKTLPELDVMVEIAVFYNVDIKEVIDGERKSENMNSEVLEAVSKAADYAKVEKKHAVRKVILTCIGGIAAAIVVALIIYVVASVPIMNVSEQDVEVKIAWCYETENGIKCFVVYETPVYTSKMKLINSAHNDTFSWELKKGLFGFKKSDNTMSRYVSYECDKNYDVITFAGKEIWSRDNNQEKKMPDFIATFEEFQTGSGKINEWTIEDEYM